MSRTAAARLAPAAIGAVVGVTLAIAAVTALVFLVRAGDPGGTNWPTDFELRSSDNGVLFQFSQDVFGGRALDWSFSPQVYVFPEIPISLLAYLFAGGTVQLYYLFVAAINNALLFLGLFAVIRLTFTNDSVGRTLARAAIATFPLLLLPLIGTTWLLSYQVAPTYYFGMYLMIFVAPTLFLACRLPTKIAIGLGLALTAASNPLALVFTVPALVIVLVVQAFARGIRTLLRPTAWSAGVLVVALVVRLALFSRLQGASPFAYVDRAIFSGRLQVIGTYLQGLVADPATATILYLGALSAVAGVIVAIVVIVRLAGHRMSWGPRTFVTLYYALVPVTGLAGTFVLIITDYLYLWPVLIAPLVFVLVPLPAGWVPWALPTAAVALVVAGTVTGGAGNLASAGNYFTYRSPETKCLDTRLPAGDEIGYATFSDARRLELTSARPFRLIQLKSSGVRAYWLTNRDYARDNVGRFFYINEHGDEPAISTSYIESHFGTPDAQFTCAPGQTVLLYDQPAKLARIKARYSTLPAP
jgi:hypothetical protein